MYSLNRFQILFHRMKKYLILKLLKYLRRVWKRGKRRSKPNECGECVYCEIMGRLRFVTLIIRVANLLTWLI